MQYKVRKMNVWQRLYIMDQMSKVKDSPFTAIAVVIKHGIKEFEDVEIHEEEFKLPMNKTCTVITDDTLDKILQKGGIDADVWNDVLQAVFKENAIPFIKDTTDGEPK